MNERDKRYDDALKAVKESSTLALAAADRAVAKAENATEKRFDAVNEFRETLADQQRTLMPRAEAELRFVSMEKTLAAIQLAQGRSAGSGEGAQVGWGYAIGAAGFVFGLIGLAIALVNVFRG
jgi:hypothetical protein